MAFGGQIQLPWWCRVLCVLSLPRCPDMWKGWGSVLKCGVVTSPPLQPLLAPGCHCGLCQHVCHILGASSREKELPQFVLFILAGFSLNIQVKQVLARLFLQPQCEEPRALGQPIRRRGALERIPEAAAGPAGAPPPCNPLWVLQIKPTCLKQGGFCVWFS